MNSLRCYGCRQTLHGTREQIGARCPQCRRPLYEDHYDSRLRPRPEMAGSECAAHAGTQAIGTCPRCGNYLCPLCRTRWQGKLVCTACVDRALSGSEPEPAEAKAHFRQAVLGLVLAIVASLAFIGAFALMIVGAKMVNPVLAGLGLIVLFGSVLPALLGLGQAAAAVRGRGDHMILATVGLFLCGLFLGCILGVAAFLVWNSQ